jgi:hypothetical protein
MGNYREREKLIADAIFEGLKRRNRGYVSGKPRAGEKTRIDGEFYLMAVAGHVLKALSSVSPDKSGG